MSVNTKRPKICKSPGCTRFVHRAHHELCHDCDQHEKAHRVLLAELLDENGRFVCEVEARIEDKDA
jgi:hypothetical protein